jgi:hypothetical protein
LLRKYNLLYLGVLGSLETANLSISFVLFQLLHTHTHTHIYIYIYILIIVYKIRSSFLFAEHIRQRGIIESLQERGAMVYKRL